ncbi:MAG TPA: hypothetical protein DIS80_12140, partial [Verrucomicrobiales bacterium]|nr:hypothetical protein [Verrucomicrobiales bacterium]
MKYQRQRKTLILSAILAGGLANVISAAPILRLSPSTIDTDTVWDSDVDDDGEIDQIYYLDEAVFVGNF